MFWWDFDSLYLRPRIAKVFDWMYQILMNKNMVIRMGLGPPLIVSSYIRCVTLCCWKYFDQQVLQCGCCAFDGTFIFCLRSWGAIISRHCLRSYLPLGFPHYFFFKHFFESFISILRTFFPTVLWSLTKESGFDEKIKDGGLPLASLEAYRCVQKKKCSFSFESNKIINIAFFSTPFCDLGYLLFSFADDFSFIFSSVRCLDLELKSRKKWVFSFSIRFCNHCIWSPIFN